MTDQPRVSVVIPCFNAVAYLPALARTLHHNAGDGIEFILVNDESKDGTGAAIDRMSTEIRGARAVHRTANGGLAAARNTGIDAASGRYVTFLDADDWLHPGHVSRLLAAIERYQTDFVRTDHVAVDGRKRRIVRSPEMRRSQPLVPRQAILPVDRSSGVDYPYAWAGIFDIVRMGKDAIRFDDGLHTAEDRPWIWRIYRSATSHAVVSLTGNYYRRGVANSLTQIADARQLHFFEAFDLVISETSADPEAELLMPKAVRSYCAIMSHHLKLRDRFDGPLQAELVGRTAKTLRALPQATLDGVFHGMGDRRAHQLRALRDPRDGGRVTQVLLSSSLYSAATLAAACEAGTIAAPSSGERVLMVANNSLFPEINADIDEIPGFAAISPVFDRVVHFNEFIHPYHPSEFRPRDDLHFWEAHARNHFGLHDDIELAVESIQVRPAQTVAGIFMGSPITVYAEGLMSYGPTRSQLGLDISERIDQVVYPDLLNGLRPVLLREFDVPYRPFDADALKKVFAQMASLVHPDAGAIDGKPLVVGQYLSALGILTPEVELGLHLDMVKAAARGGSGRVCFKPHPGAPPAATAQLAERAKRHGIQLVPILDDNPLEVLLSAATPSAIVSAFSTALVTAGRLYGIPVGCVGTELLLEELRPYENSNRIPVTVIDHLVNDISSESSSPAVIDDASFDVAHLQDLVETVGYCMQPDRLPMLRPTAEAFLSAEPDSNRRRYVKRRRLAALALPGAPYVPMWKRLASRYRDKPLVAKVRTARRRLADGSLKPADLPHVALKSLRGKR